MRQPSGQGDARLRHAQIVGQQTDNSLVGFAIRWRGRGSHAQLTVFHALNFVLACARLNPHLHDQIFTLPSRNAAINAAQIGKGRSVLKNMAAACKAMIAKIGEMSSPPIGRMTRLNGRITGSTSIEINAVAGLYVPGAIQLNMM